MKKRVFYAAGPGDVIRAHRHWTRDEPDPTQLPTAYSNEFCDFCRAIGAEAYIVSSHQNKRIVEVGSITLEHRPKPRPSSSGLAYHLFELVYAYSLLRTAVRFRAKWAFFHSGSAHFFSLSAFRLLGIRVVVLLHNTLWPTGHPPSGRVQRLVAQLNSMFFRWAATAVVGVSPECIRQVNELTGGDHRAGLYEMRPHYYRQIFHKIPSPPSFDRENPLVILWSGRMEDTKGALEVLEIARLVEQRAPGRVRWQVVGDGSGADRFLSTREKLGLNQVVLYLGWQYPAELLEIVGRTHATIVPTKSSFAEGLAKTAVESILSGRPVITSKIVPALELFRPACLEAKPDDPASYADLILHLIDAPNHYCHLSQACLGLQEQFFEEEFRMRSVLKQVINRKAQAVLPASEVRYFGTTGTAPPAS